MAKPVPPGTPVSFAYKRLYRTGKPHKGVDFGCIQGTKVTAAISGTVWYAGVGGGWGPAYGAHVIIQGSVHGKIRYVQVAHLSRLDVKTGQVVKIGKQLGLSGGVPGLWGAGNSTGAHVHFQVNRSSFWSDHVDPWPAIGAESGDRMDPAAYFMGATGAHVTWLGERLVAHGFGAHYSKGPGPIFGKTDKANVTDFQKAQGWSGKNADGFPGSQTLVRLAGEPQPAEPAKPAAPVAAKTAKAGKGTMILRPLWYNIPGPDKLKRDSERAIAGAALVKTGAPSVFGMNELIGPGKNSTTNTGSAFAKKIDSALGSDYSMVVPTTAFNENYLFFEKKTTRLVEKLPDKILAARVGGKAVPGRHLTLAVFEDIASGTKFVFGNTHLVNGKQWGAGRSAQAAIAMTELERVAALHDNCPILVGGDMNRSDDLRAFINAGLVNMRKVAKTKSDSTKFSTHTNIRKDSARKSAEWIIDHGYCSKGMVVNAYDVALGYDATGTFPPVRPSDHVPILFSVTLPD
ncbi:murein DD-endopeptidase MepM/ murein hydrolase activator NlpD [Aeromicrobium panaciterrae]|uniref:Murein DD-endopeptidase MepM/ murein hydrolase activator NlpD n=1 Tax=Aeromicrobium panaciterrae TaxID=363861 RepID=A0ABU1UQQ8_9ACTN|nr:peptidoglycan-binding protein [Aeromicrobium panaciterrae]MDR7087524.1 murein DD-endopeptidase MepM/ murein hydrolase activator NlpD [Aeromicrobium panaciterrae]